MKNILLNKVLVLISLLFVGSASTSYAAVGDGVKKRHERRQDRREDRRERRQDRREDRQERRQDRRDDRKDRINEATENSAH